MLGGTPGTPGRALGRLVRGTDPVVEVPRSRAWVLTRRFTHTAHHRGQLTACIRAWGRPLYSTYGPTADTGGLPKNGARVIYPSAMGEAVLSGGTSSDARPDLPAPSEAPVTERP